MHTLAVPRKPSITDALKLAIELAGGRQEDLAELAGCSRTYIGQCLNAGRPERISPRLALKIEKALKGKVKAEWLRPYGS